MKNEHLKKKGKQMLMLIQSPLLIFKKACGLLIHTWSQHSGDYAYNCGCDYDDRVTGVNKPF